MSKPEDRDDKKSVVKRWLHQWQYKDGHRTPCIWCGKPIGAERVPFDECVMTPTQLARRLKEDERGPRTIPPGR